MWCFEKMIDGRGGVFDDPPIEIGGYKMLDVVRTNILSKKKGKIFQKHSFSSYFFKYYFWKTTARNVG